MTARRGCIGLIVALGLLCGCSATRGKPFQPSLIGQEFYLCCTTSFNPKFEAADSNYGQYRQGQHVFGQGPMLVAGTRIKVVGVGSHGIAFQPVGGTQTYTLMFDYGKKQMSVSQYFRNILRETNPMDTVANAPPDILAGIKQGQLAVGMTKDEALLARGYPPLHRTKNLDSNEWIYYETPGFIDRVSFVNGKIQSVTRGSSEGLPR